MWKVEWTGPARDYANNKFLYPAPEPDTVLIVLRGTIEIPDTTREGNRYRDVEEFYGGKELVVVCERDAEMPHGLACYTEMEYRGERSLGRHGTHFGNTLLNDPSFEPAFRSAGGHWTDHGKEI